MNIAIVARTDLLLIQITVRVQTVFMRRVNLVSRVSHLTTMKDPGNEVGIALRVSLSPIRLNDLRPMGDDSGKRSFSIRGTKRR